MPGTELSAVIGTPGDHDSIRRTVEHLRSQTVARRMELVVVAPRERSLSPTPQDLDSFGRCRVVELDEVVSVAQANAAGARAAGSPVVAFCEDHCFPAPDWAEALIDAHAGPWAAVAPVFRNANPATAVSRADFLVGYAPWIEPTDGGEADMLPGHNTSYSRDVLLRYDDRLERMLAAEAVFHAVLRDDGHRLRVEPRARVAHLNFSRPVPWLRVLFHQGRVFAASRAAGWGAGRRLAYVVGGPLIPLVRFVRIVRNAARDTAAYAGPATLMTLWLGLLADGAGQLTGHVTLSPGRRGFRQADFDRVEHLTAADRRGLG